MIVDSHQHFWSLRRGDYHWLTSKLAPLYRDYLPAELEGILAANSVRATVLIQAAATEAETHYLLELAREHEFIAGVVGWTDFAAPDAPERIAALVAAGGGRLKGLRPMIQDIANPVWVAQPDLDAAFGALIDHGLTFDALVRPVHLEALLRRLERDPRLKAVIDHAGKPALSNSGDLTTWRAGIARLAARTDACCKLSGLLTEAPHGATAADLDACVSHVFACFGAARVLWGSDWPVLNLAADYAHWLALSRALVARYVPSDREREGVFAANAMRFYRLDLA